MLRALRTRLTLLYLLASLGLVALLGAGTYGLLSLYFQQSTDLALQYKMATEFRNRGLSLPVELANAEQSWSQGGSIPMVPLSTKTPIITDEDSETEDEHSPNNPGSSQADDGGESDDRYDSRLAPVFVVPDVGSASTTGGPVVNDPQAISQALRTGIDIRTIKMDNGANLRLLTYRIGDGSVLQVGRLLTDQERLLSQYLTGLIIMGSSLSLVLALASWMLAGRSIKPTQRAWDQQQQFISNASHELRTPLTILRASADYALRSSSKNETQKSLEEIIEECDYMNRMVEDLLLLSRIDAKRLALDMDIVSVPELLAEITRQFEKLAEAKGCNLILEPARGEVRADRDRLRQVLLILLDNALRATPKGGDILLGAQVRGREVSIYVADNGPGITPEHLQHIFERFYQLPGQPSEERGNGLGLSIARGLVEAQHGKITISSEIGKGTQVNIIFPSEK